MQAEKVMEVLRRVEWGGFDRFCPWCHFPQCGGHADDCKLAVLLDEEQQGMSELQTWLQAVLQLLEEYISGSQADMKLDAGLADERDVPPYRLLTGGENAENKKSNEGYEDKCIL